MKIENLKVGQTYWSVSRSAMGNTSVKTTGLHPVRITEIDVSDPPRWAMASWNHNSPRKFFLRTISKWREKKPILIHSHGIGGSRLATREELKQIAAGTFTGKYS